MDPGVVVDLRPLHHPEHGADRGRVERHRAGEAEALGDHLDVGPGGVVRGDDQLDHARTRPSDRVDRDGAGVGEGAGEGGERAVGDTLGDLPGLGVAVQHGVAHVVDRARADRVVGGVADHLAPGEVEERARPGVGVGEERGEGLGPALEGAFGRGGRPLHVDAVRRHAHEQVGPGPRPQFALPALEPVGRGFGQVLGQRGELEVVVVLELVRLGDHPAQEGLGREVVRAVHEQDPIDEEGRDLRLVVLDAPHERLRVVGKDGPVAVADREVLGAHRRAVGRLPEEPGLGDRGGHAPPDDRVLEAGLAKELGHLRHVAEHVGEVPDRHRPAEGGGPLRADLEVAHEGLGRDEELVHQDVPRPHGQPAARGQRAQARLGLGADLQVVVDRGHLAVEQVAGVGGVGLHQVEQLVDRVDQVHAERLVGLVPLAIPVGVGDDADVTRCHRLRLRAPCAPVRGRSRGPRAPPGTEVHVPPLRR